MAKLERRDEQKVEPFEFSRALALKKVPKDRIPAPGISLILRKYHETNTLVPDEIVPETGFTPNPITQTLLTHK